jgi:hypothetical protein
MPLSHSQLNLPTAGSTTASEVPYTSRQLLTASERKKSQLLTVTAYHFVTIINNRIKSERTVLQQRR